MKEITIPPLSRKCWNEMEELRKQVDMEPSDNSYEEYLERMKKTPMKAMFG